MPKKSEPRSCGSVLRYFDLPDPSVAYAMLQASL